MPNMPEIDPTTAIGATREAFDEATRQFCGSVNRFRVAGNTMRIRSHPLVPRDIPIHGYIFDVKTGKFNEMKEASEIGRATCIPG